MHQNCKHNDMTQVWLDGVSDIQACEKTHSFWVLVSIVQSRMKASVIHSDCPCFLLAYMSSIAKPHCYSLFCVDVTQRY